MKEIGYNHPLYLLPFDHRGSFLATQSGSNVLTADHAADVAAAQQQLADAKHVVYDAFQKAMVSGVPRDKAGILVDEQFGTVILSDAVRQGYLIACPVEKSGQEEFDFEYGSDFVRHIEQFKPTFCKALVRYNPEGNARLNARQVRRLKRLSDYLRDTGECSFICELLVPPTREQLERCRGDNSCYDCELRPLLTNEAIRQLQDARVEPDVWMLEGFEGREDYEKTVATATRGGRGKVGCIVLGRGEGDEQARKWLTVAAGVPGLIGFAVGRTAFWEPLAAWVSRLTTREAAVVEIAQRYREYVKIFEAAHAQVAEAAEVH